MPASGEKEQMSAEEIEQRVLAPLKHGMRERGINAEIDRLTVLLATNPGRIAVRQELAANLVLIIQRGLNYLDTDIGAGYAREGAGPLSYLGGYMNTLERMLRTWPDPIEEALHVDELKRIDEVLGRE